MTAARKKLAKPAGALRSPTALKPRRRTGAVAPTARKVSKSPRRFTIPLRYTRELFVGSPASNEEVDTLREKLGFDLPDDYVAALRIFNGAEGEVGENSNLKLWSTVDTVTRNKRLCVSEWRTDVFLIGSDGATNMYGIQIGPSGYTYFEVGADNLVSGCPHKLSSSFKGLLKYLYEQE